MFGSGNKNDHADDHPDRLALLERRVELLERALRSYGIPVESAYQGGPAPSVSPAVQQLVRDGKKIEAVRALVQETGMGLREAKDVVDRL